MALSDQHASEHAGLEAPAEDWENITLGTAPSFRPRALTCTTEGDVVLVSATGKRATVTLVPGAVFPCRPIRVDSPASGAASGVVALR